MLDLIDIACLMMLVFSLARNRGKVVGRLALLVLGLHCTLICGPPALGR
jgi:hypothetical protein